MKRVGITGQAGFIGTHLFNTIGLSPEKLERIPFEDDFFQDQEKLKKFAAQCDAIVHLAAMNRHDDPQVLYETNIRLVKQLIAACEAVNATPHILFASSTQEEHDNPYGKSKKEGRKLFDQWAQKNKAPFTAMVIPNVFGPFGKPYYNSVVATFCHQLTHNEQPKIIVDGEIKLIFVSDLVLTFIKQIEVPPPKPSFYKVSHTSSIKVSALLEKLKAFKKEYYDKGMLPMLAKNFDRNLFNTFVCYIDHENFWPFHLTTKTDERGSFVEILRLQGGGQVSFSTTLPGITRGNHFHTRKAERFVVIRGKARIEIRRIGTDKKHSYELDGRQPSFVDMPVWYTHKITNTGNEDLYTIFWISEHFDANEPDTYFEKV